MPGIPDRGSPFQIQKTEVKMKVRKRKTQLEQEKRNALYNKTIKHNLELAKKNCELSCLINKFQNAICKANERKWWQVWKWFRKPIVIN